VSALILGADPGKKGALALVDLGGHLIDVIDMPDATGSALGAHIRGFLEDHGPHHVQTAWVEKVGSMPGQGHMNVFTFGAGYGALLGALGALRIPVELRTPNVWKKAMRCSADKGSSRQAATQLWPDHARLFARVKDDGRAEAALIAEYGRRHGT
jgi:crossover junction endodeoxyribonuclease RuvC